MMVGEPQVVAENIEVFQPVLVRLSVFHSFYGQFSRDGDAGKSSAGTGDFRPQQR
jgi:hypothetical protein